MSMLNLNFSNAEKLIFSNSDIHHLFPAYFSSFFEQWKLSKRLPMLKSLGKSAILDFINQLNESHLSILEEYFGERIILEKLYYEAVTNIKVPLSETDVCQRLCNITYHSYYSLWRDEEYLYITFWR